ncbi:hypothetical protein QTO34_003142 [Cnephaeus nilssonii]|uniref:VWFD domain-containing protein n=1 Tax=Cnephaeus nilssonii TaxID=3371016 RepID=A0AA40LJ17_CNENI|nr:hypothetical protein QTO34_003142 [Eptesicus nilssonii]
MGVGRREPARLWALALALALACAQHTGGAQLGSAPSSEHPHLSPAPQGPGGDALRGVTILPPLRTAPVVRALNPAHNGRVCSTWGDFHYKTFDGDVFLFPGRCNYVFSAHCGAAYEDFNVQLRRGPGAPAGALRGVTMKLRGLVLQLTPNSVLVNGRPIQLPFSQSGVLVEHSASFLKVVARLGLVFMWNQDGSLLLELDAKYANQTCGLCGDFNGVPVFDEFFSHGTKLSAVEFGNLQKMDGPTEQCQDPAPAPPGNCSVGAGLCEELLLGEPFLGCHALVDAGSFVRACQQDLCLCAHADLARCACLTLAEYSRQCAHAGGLPPDWRGPGLCPQTCPHNMRYQECGSPCADTCSNQEHSQLCEDHCVAGCFCPEGMVLDDIGQTGCIPVSQCPCVHSGATYAPGATYSTDCTNCTCSGGRWNCREVPCPGTCAVLGGAHFFTFDERPYTVHGDCSYVLAKPCNSSAFTVLAELRRCGLTDSETCLRSLTLSLDGGRTVVEVKASGEVLVNQLVTQLPVSAADVTVFRPSTFFVVAQTRLGLQAEVQLVPTMQVFLRAAPALRGRTCGLCGNFNQNQADDLRALSGVVEGTAAAFANTWKTQAACPDVRGGFEDPCALSVENGRGIGEKPAPGCPPTPSSAHREVRSALVLRAHRPAGPLRPVPRRVSPGPYHSNCLFDTCNCEKSEDCLCAALSAYVPPAPRGACCSAAGGPASAVTKPMDTCPPSMTYRYHVGACQPTCRALSSQDPACGVSFVPVDGCTCPNGTFLDDAGSCVPAASCPCYHGDTVVPNGESLHERGAVCTCTQGTLTCIGGNTPDPVCAPPMVYMDCRNATPGAAGAGCQKSCHTLDVDCYSPQCVPGCVCPAGLVADGEGGCVAADECPCMHNEARYRAARPSASAATPEREVAVHGAALPGTCAVYGDGHYLTFDGQRYSFNGACEYTLLQDHCGGNGSAQDAFRVVTENVPCGTTGTTCSKAIKIFLGSYELKLSEGQVEVIEKGLGQEAPYSIRQVGIYLVVDTEAGLVLLWDKKTSIFLRLSPEFKGRVCGLCGNFDDNAVNDFTTRSQSVVGDALEFGNSWKFSPTCPDAPAPRDPCTANPYRKSWAQRRCSLLNSATFEACHAHVEPAQYYEACVSDACACDSGGDCECFCTAVAAYAQACHDAGVCVAWRTPDICREFVRSPRGGVGPVLRLLQPEGQCAWHYQPCGAPCLRTCRNPRGQCLHDTGGLEGCYPKCPPEAPIFDEDAMRCVAACPAPPPPPPCQVRGKSYRPGAVVPSDENCHSCICTENGVRCAYDAEACVCSYDGRRFRPGDVIYHTTDGTGGCISARCGPNGTIERTVHACGSSSPAPPPPSPSPRPRPPAAVPPPRVCGTPRGPAPIVGRQTADRQGARTGPVQGPSACWALTLGPLPSLLPAAVSSTGPPGPATSPAPTSTPRPRPSTASVAPGPACGEDCLWSAWLDVSRPGRGLDSGDFDTLDNLRAHGYPVCQAPRAVECRAERAPDVPFQVLGQQVECSPAVGLTCYNRDQASGLCDNYQVRVLCCSPRACPTSRGPATHSTTCTSVPTAPVTTTAPALSPPHLPLSPPHLPCHHHRTCPRHLLTCPRHLLTCPGTTSSPAPGTSSPAPGTTSSPAPGTSSPAPGTTSSPAPGTSSPAPGTTSSPAPGTTSSPAPGTSSPAPGTTTHCPGTSSPAPSHHHTCPCHLLTCPRHLLTCPRHLLTCPRHHLTCPRHHLLTCPRHLLTCPVTTTPALSPPHLPQAPPHLPQAPPHLPQAPPHLPQAPPPHLPQAPPHLPQAPPHCPRHLLTCPRHLLTCPGTTSPAPGTTSSPAPGTTSPAPGTTSTSAPGPSEVPTTWQPSTSPCWRESCSWTEWLDGSYPEAGINGGDFDTFQNLRSEGYAFCERPSQVECRAERFPDTPLAELGQSVVCSDSVGLLCLNKDQLPPICYNYQIRIQCCEWLDVCRERTIPPETSRATRSTPHSTRTHTQAPQTSTQHWTASSAHVPPATTTTPSTHAVTPRETTRCQPQCTWTKWFDVDFPSPGPHGGDAETYSNIVRSGERICGRPEYIAHLECRAQSRPEVSIARLGQVVQCSPDVGLVCRNRDQAGRFQMCLNYEVRVLCCEPRAGCPTFEPVTTPSTPSVSISSPTETTSHVATSSTTSVPATSTTSVPATSTTSCRQPAPPPCRPPAPPRLLQPAPPRLLQPAPPLCRPPAPPRLLQPAPPPCRPPAPPLCRPPAPPRLLQPAPPPCRPPAPPPCRPPAPPRLLQPAPPPCRPPAPPPCRQPAPPPCQPPAPPPFRQPAPPPCRQPAPPRLLQPAPPLCRPPAPPPFRPPAPPLCRPPAPPRLLQPAPLHAGHQHHLGSYNQHHLRAGHQHHLRAGHQHHLGSYNQHHLGSYNQHHLGSYNQHHLGSYNQHHFCAGHQHHLRAATSTTSVPATSTTSAPITTTTPVPAPQTTLPTSGTTSCQPQCTWTKWFDVDFPSPGPHGGDAETYSNIVRSGERICGRPEYIAHLECRAQSHPEVSIARLGQVVQCSPDVGLVCRNRDQTGRFQMCLNYEVRVLCCEPRAGCPLTSVTPDVTSTKSLPTTASSSVVPTVTTLSTATPSVPPCYCSVSDKLYPAGSIIYQEADLAGHCYYAVCSLDCHVVRQTDHACPTSTPPSTPATLPPGSSSSAPVTVTTPGCPSAVPPRTRGETWAMPNCSQATCEGNNVITLGPRPCPQVPAPTCANGYPALKVPDEDGCCLHYQCQCVCSGWGDPHYITFDGTYYTFLDNCTYVLVQQIVPVYGHFRVLIDNYFCDAEDGLSCPQSIIVEYGGARRANRKPSAG